jgi:hypothetical protein
MTITANTTIGSILGKTSGLRGIASSGLCAAMAPVALMALTPPQDEILSSGHNWNIGPLGVAKIRLVLPYC